MEVLTYASIAVLTVILGAQIFLRSFLYKRYFLIAAGIIVSVFGWLAHLAQNLYVVWASSEFTRGLVPPFAPARYFVGYVGFRIFAPYITSLIAAVIFIFWAKYINKRFGYRFFEAEEIYIAAIAIFLVSWPGAVLYVVAVLLFSIIGSVILRFKTKDNSVRLPLYFVWLPTAIFVILIRGWLLNATGLWVIGFARIF